MVRASFDIHKACGSSVPDIDRPATFHSDLDSIKGSQSQFPRNSRSHCAPTLRYQQLSTTTIMSPPSVDSGPLPDVFRAKLTTLVRDQLKPIVAELAAQQETILSHIALLKHNYNVNDYQMTRLENIRNLEQSIKCAFRCPFADRATNRAIITALKSRVRLVSVPGSTRAWGPTYASPSQRTL